VKVIRESGSGTGESVGIVDLSSEGPNTFPEELRMILCLRKLLACP
jgi:hypothetical protein